MPVPYQIIPEHVYPHQAVYINDNTEVSKTYSSSSSDVTALLCVFASPKGRDNKVITIDTGSQGFVNEFGIGPFSLYGQPLLNAYHAMSMNAVSAYSSVMSALSFERMTEKLTSSINMTKSGVKQKKSPIEQIITM